MRYFSRFLKMVAASIFQVPVWILYACHAARGRLRRNAPQQPVKRNSTVIPICTPCSGRMYGWMLSRRSRGLMWSTSRFEYSISTKTMKKSIHAATITARIQSRTQMSIVRRKKEKSPHVL
eukprot:Amastigsp_a339311_539.p3 type:complete len:121 gc:universal Amastigsp_a339311_539:371-9(-)